jgi:uncharacterized membrane protein YdjX (TVP38/TMEM64 family)
MDNDRVSRAKNPWLWVWLVVAGLSLVGGFANPSWLEPSSWRDFFIGHAAWAIPLFALACVVRVFVFVPAATLLLAGMLFLDPVTLMVVTTLGFMLASTLLYYGAQWLRLDTVFEQRYPDALQRLRTAMEKHGLWVVFLWAFFPAVPTDLISYVAGTLSLKFPRFLISVTLGQTVLALIYVLAGTTLMKGFGVG